MSASDARPKKRDVAGRSRGGHLSVKCVVMRERSERVRFGPFELDMTTGELWRGGQSIRLQQQPFRILKLLVDRDGALVSRQELIHALWPDGTYVGFERALNSAIRKARESLGDRADAPMYIETLQRRGYRFIAPVQVAPRPPVLAARYSWRGARIARTSAAVVLLALAAANGHRTPPAMVAERLAAAEALSQYACRLKSERKFDDALAVIQRAHAIAPESARITAEVGLHLHSLKRYDEEMPMLLRAVDQDQRSADAWMHLGLGYARRSNFAAAVPALERAVALDPHASGPQQWLAWARVQRS
jgi:DNA-binding winged helix-turn-helix (wHTH) protein